MRILQNQLLVCGHHAFNAVRSITLLSIKYITISIVRGGCIWIKLIDLKMIHNLGKAEYTGLKLPFTGLGHNFKWSALPIILSCIKHLAHHQNLANGFSLIRAFKMQKCLIYSIQHIPVYSTVLQRCRAKYQLADFAKELPSPLSPPLPALLRDQIATCATELVKYKNTLHQN